MKRAALLVLMTALLGGCAPEGKGLQKISLFVGVDVSGSFYKSGHYEGALEFLAHYIYAHLNGVGGLKPLKALFVGSIGGDMADEAKSFHPIQDFEGKSVAQIEADLKRWFPRANFLTDFNVFFRQVANIASKRNLSLSPIAVVLVSDGLPDFPGKSQDSFDAIDVSPLEFLSRSMTVRLLYASPVAADKWETMIPRKRVRMWTVDDQVMSGWKRQVEPEVSIRKQTKLWKWVMDNVDYRVQPSRRFLIRSAKK